MYSLFERKTYSQEYNLYAHVYYVCMYAGTCMPVWMYVCILHEDMYLRHCIYVYIMYGVYVNMYMWVHAYINAFMKQICRILYLCRCVHEYR